jgi:group II intron reverse transcriptase/maturase/CRISPR-associated endonuclease Cas1
MGDLYKAVASETNLLEAWRRAGRRRTAGGVDGVGRDAFAEELDRHVRELSAELLAYRYVPLPSRQVLIPKLNDAGEWRELELPALRDKVVQQAVRQVIEPLFEARFLDCSYAYRKERGGHRAVRRVLHELAQRRGRFVVKSDIDDFFDTIDHRRLFTIVEEIVQDADVMRLVRLFVQNGVIEASGEIRDPLSGVPTGSVLAPLLSNAYLHGFDVYLRERGDCHVRYADDWVILCPDRERARDAAEAARVYLRERLGLRLNQDKDNLLEVARGFPFLGFFILNGRLSLHRDKLRKVERHLADLEARGRAWSLDGLLRALTEKAEGWQRYYRIVDEKKDLVLIDDLLVDLLVRAIAARVAAGQLARDARWDERLRRFPWPGERPAPALERFRRRLEEALAGPDGAAEAEQAARDQQVGRLARRQRQRYRKVAMEKSEIVVWRRGAFLGRRGERVVARKGEGEKPVEHPIGRVRSIVVKGDGVMLSSDLLDLCAEKGVPLSFLDDQGQPYAILHAPRSLRTDLLLCQLRASGAETGLGIARALAQAKVRNQANLLKYFAKYHKETGSGLHGRLRELAAEALGQVATLRAVQLAAGCDYDLARGQLMAAEGQAAQAYWTGVGLLVGDELPFPGRVHQEARDPVNAALNYGYGILYARIEVEILKAGLHPQVAFLHKAGRGRAVLAFDLIEPQRAPVVDRTVIAMISRREPIAVDGDGRLPQESRRRVADNVLERWRTETPYAGGVADYEAIVRDQLRQIADVLQGKGRLRPFVQRW